MSWPVTVFTCTRCDFRQGDSHTWGSREYLLADGVRVSVPRRLGWCHSCGSIAAVEDLSGDAQREECEETERELADLRFWKLRERKWLQQNLADLQDTLQLLKQRKSPARCLHCGSADIGSISIHPGCGGVLQAKLSDVRLALRRTVVLYTPEGMEIEHIDIDGHAAGKLYFEGVEKMNARVRSARRSDNDAI